MNVLDEQQQQQLAMLQAQQEGQQPGVNYQQEEHYEQINGEGQQMTQEEMMAFQAQQQ